MIDTQIRDIKEKLLDRKNYLTGHAQKYIPASETLRMLEEIESALDRIDGGRYGMCEVCGDPIEEDRLEANPFLKVCIDHFDHVQQKFLEEDLSLAVKIQRNLLPSAGRILPGWEMDYHYEPASIVSGDYCDVMNPENDGKYQYVIVGDVSGKGVAASMLMSQLHAMMHALVPFNLGVQELMSKMNRILCESTIANQFATLVLVKTHADGTLEISNAGHCQPLLISSNGAREIPSDGIPLGVFGNSEYGSRTVQLSREDVLILFTDGLPEAMNGEDCFELSRVLSHEQEFRQMSPRQILDVILYELSTFLGDSRKSDDLTVVVLKKQ